MTEDRIPDYRIRYNKNRKKDGNPITVWNVHKNTEEFTDHFSVDDCDITVRFGNAILQEKACGATSILEVYQRRKDTVRPDNTHTDSIQYKTIQTKSPSPYCGCSGCGYKFKRGDIRHIWRLRLVKNFHYLSGGFWTTNCIDCFRTNLDGINDGITQLRPQLGSD